jgi:hypothetical protein
MSGIVRLFRKLPNEYTLVQLNDVCSEVLKLAQHDLLTNRIIHQCALPRERSANTRRSYAASTGYIESDKQCCRCHELPSGGPTAPAALDQFRPPIGSFAWRSRFSARNNGRSSQAHIRSILHDKGKWYRAWASNLSNDHRGTWGYVAPRRYQLFWVDV